MPRVPRSVCLAFLGFVASAFQPLLAQDTAGRIAGLVKDRGGVAVPSVQVVIVGTTLEAVTDDSGRYVVTVPSAGSYTLRARSPGYAARDLANVRVDAGQTLTVDFTLLPLAAPGPIGPGDRATSRVVLDGSAFHDLPAVEPRDVLALQPGVFETRDARGLSLRGAKPGAAAQYIDGALIPSASLGTNAIEEAAITTGALGAEVGDGRAGAISFVTRAGGSRWESALRYRTDDIGVNAWGTVGFHRVEASLGGPLRPNLTLFTALTLNGQQSLDTEKDRDAQAPVYVMSGIDTVVHQPETWGDPNTDTALVTIPRFVQYSGDCAESSNFGVSCQGLRVPFTATGSYAWQAKLQHTYGTAARVSLTGLASRLQQRDFPGVNLYNPSDYTGTGRQSRAAILSWSQDLGRLRGGPLALDLNLSYQRVKGISGLLTRASELDTRDPFGGFLLQPLEYLFDSHYRHDVRILSTTYRSVGLLDDAQIRCIQAGEGACQDDVPLLNRGDLASAQPYRMNPYAVEQSARSPLWTQGVDVAIDLSREARWQARADVEWQSGRSNRIRLGGNLDRIDTRRYQAISAISAFAINAYHESPVQYGGYVEDRHVLGRVRIVGGLRYDRFDSRARFAEFPGRIATDVDSMSLVVPPGESRSCRPVRAFDPQNPAARLCRASSHSTWSPRAQLLVPVTARSAVRMSYARQVQAPPFDLMFQAKNTDLSITNRSQLFGRDVDLPRSTILELGVRQTLSRDLALTATAYDANRPAEIVFRLAQLPDPAQNGQLGDFWLLSNADFGHARGVEVALDGRVSSLLAGSLAYTYSTGGTTPRNSGNAPKIATHDVAGWIALTTPRGWKAGTLLGSVLQNGAVFATFRWTSGRHYTRVFPEAAGYTTDASGGSPIELLNASGLPWSKTVDVRVTRGMKLGRFDGAVFAEARNLFNFTNVLGRFTESDDVTYQDFRSRYVAEQRAVLTTEAQAAGILATDQSIDFTALGGCQNWQGRNSGNFASGPVDCVLLERAERRYGDGNGVFTQSEYARAFDAWYNLANAPYRFYGPGRRIRVGLELAF